MHPLFSQVRSVLSYFVVVWHLHFYYFESFMILTRKSSFYLWIALVCVCTSFMAVYVPLRLVFSLETSIFLDFLYWISSAVYLLDFALNLIRKREDHRSSDSGHLKKRFSYLSGWLLIDLIAAIPFGIMGGLSYWQLLKLIKILRIGQYMHRIRLVEFQYSQILSVFYLFFWSGHIAHWISCSWIAIIGENPAQGIASSYIASLYWVVTTGTTVGYGDIVPVTDIQRLFSVFVQLLGLVFFGYIIGNMVSIVSKRDPEKVKYLENVEKLSSLLRSRYIPKDLQKRILDYYGYLRDKNMGYDESSFLNTLPDGLRMEVELILKKDLIEEIPLFKSASKEFINECALQLQLLIASPNQYVIKAGEEGNDMYFIMSGDMEVSDEEGQILCTLGPGNFFGEMALYSDQTRNASVKAVNFCQLYRLNNKIFQTIQAKFPDISSQIKEEANKRRK